MAEASVSTSGSPHRLNLSFLKRAIHLAKPFWFLDEKKRARWLLFLLMLLLIGYTEFAVLFNQQSGEFTSALAERNGKIYVIGGFVKPASGPSAWQPIDNLWEYDPANDRWKALAPMPGGGGTVSGVASSNWR